MLSHAKHEHGNKVERYIGDRHITAAATYEMLSKIYTRQHGGTKVTILLDICDKDGHVDLISRAPLEEIFVDAVQALDFPGHKYRRLLRTSD
jgi:hypothetical protein